MGEKVCKSECMCSQKVTVMELKVDLQCCKCYKKVKKVLCNFPQIQDQEYDKKNNKVIIKVVCCNPEMIRDKLCCKGDGAIKSIKILEPKKENDKTPPPKNSNDKDPPSSSPEEKPNNITPPKSPTPCHPPCCKKCYDGRCGGQCYPSCRNPVWDCCRECYERHGGGPYYHPAPRVCCRECSKGRGGGPCYHLGCEQKIYYWYCGGLVYDNWRCGSCGGGSAAVTAAAEAAAEAAAAEAEAAAAAAATRFITEKCVRITSA